MKESVIRARVTEQEKQEFYAACKQMGEKPSEALRDYMRIYIELLKTEK